MDFIDDICEKYGYDNELKVAISRIFPIMLQQYGEDRKNDIIETFRDVRIFKSKDMSKTTRDNIKEIMMSGVNENIKFIEEDPYGNDMDPGSYYCNNPVFNEKMKNIGSRKWINIIDMQDSRNGESYKEMFGTYINLPYLIHELGHAFAMNKSKAVVRGKELYIKQGMLETLSDIEIVGDKINITEKENKNIIIEEMINEKDTQEMLCKYMNLDSYSEVKQKLDDINHVNTSYTPVLISIAEKMESVIGKEQLLELRIDNNMKVKENFRQKAKKTKIYEKYLANEDVFEYLDEKTFELFQLKLSCYKMTVEEYKEKTERTMVKAFAPLCAYEEAVNLDSMNESRYTEISNNILKEYDENNLQKSLKGQVKENIEITEKTESGILTPNIENIIK